MTKRHDNYGKSLHVNINADSNTDYDAFEDVYVPREFKNPDTNRNAVSLQEYDREYITTNAGLESRTPIRSRDQLKCMYPEWMYDSGEFKILNIILS